MVNSQNHEGQPYCVFLRSTEVSNSVECKPHGVSARMPAAAVAARPSGLICAQPMTTTQLCRSSQRLEYISGYDQCKHTLSTHVWPWFRQQCESIPAVCQAI
eukprot:792855-Amphidinium_carterae.2